MTRYSFTFTPESQSTNSRASAPFDNSDDDSDLIIRTPDKFDFYVHKLILVKASPFFYDMLSLPQGSRARVMGLDTTADIPTVDVAEKSQTWDLLLRLCYPVIPPVVDDITEYWHLLEAARKYLMENVSRRIRNTLLRSGLTEKEPLRIYALACGFGFAKLARTAARYSLRKPLGGPELEEFARITARAYHRLLLYHQKCGEVASGVADSKSLVRSEWLRAYSDCTFFQCEKCAAGTIPGLPATRPVFRSMDPSFILKIRPRAYLDEYLNRTEVALKSRPYGSIVSDPTMLGPVIQAANECVQCRKSIFTDLLRFAGAYEKEVDRIISEVELVIDN